MSKLSAEAFVTLANLVEEGKIIQLEKMNLHYEIIVFDGPHHQSNHSHYQGEDLIDAISKIQ